MKHRDMLPKNKDTPTPPLLPAQKHCIIVIQMLLDITAVQFASVDLDKINAGQHLTNKKQQYMHAMYVDIPM